MHPDTVKSAARAEEIEVARASHANAILNFFDALSFMMTPRRLLLLRLRLGRARLVHFRRHRVRRRGRRGESRGRRSAVMRPEADVDELGVVYPGGASPVVVGVVDHAAHDQRLPPEAGRHIEDHVDETA